MSVRDVATLSVWRLAASFSSRAWLASFSRCETVDRSANGAVIISVSVVWLSEVQLNAVTQVRYRYNARVERAAPALGLIAPATRTGSTAKPGCGV